MNILAVCPDEQLLNNIDQLAAVIGLNVEIGLVKVLLKRVTNKDEFIDKRKKFKVVENLEIGIPYKWETDKGYFDSLITTYSQSLNLIDCLMVCLGGKVRKMDEMIQPPPTLGTPRFKEKLTEWQKTYDDMKADLVLVEISNIDFPSVLYDHLDLSFASLTGVRCQAMSMSRISFMFSELTHVQIFPMQVEHFELSGSKFRNVKFIDTTFTHFNAICSEMTEVTFSGFVRSSHKSFIGNAKFWGSNLSQCHFNKAFFLASDFQNSKISHSDFFDASLIRANFTSANLFDAKFSGAVLDSATLIGAEFNDCEFKMASLVGVSIWDPEVPVAFYRTKGGEATFHPKNIQPEISPMSAREMDLALIKWLGENYPDGAGDRVGPDWLLPAERVALGLEPMVGGDESASVAEDSAAGSELDGQNENENS